MPLAYFDSKNKLAAQVQKLTADLTAAQGSVATLTASLTEKDGEILTLNGKLADALKTIAEVQGAADAAPAAAEAKVAGVDAEVKEKAAEAAIEIVASAGVPIVATKPSEVAPEERVKAPATFAEFCANFARLTGDEQGAYFAAHYSAFSGK